ncbi:FOG: TPR repeat [hydrothermal vent metagenome]|uniref:FOG: TPR repeat n=1 Tax=hydrothermal vent metagenome TaxID=652676 RepID=A0A1W1CNP6_9ZZZZ
MIKILTKRFKSLFPYLLILLVLVGCNHSNSQLQPPLAHQKSLKSILPKYPIDKVPYQSILKKNISMPKKGDKSPYGITISKEMETAYNNYLNGNGEIALQALETINNHNKDTRLLWQTSLLKMQTLLMMGLASEALEDVPTCIEYEQQLFKTDLNCKSMRGEINVWLGDLDNAKKDFESVLLEIGNWELPTIYFMPPSNMTELVSKTTAQLRAYTGLTAMNTLKENYEEAYYWGMESEKRFNALHYVSNHWLYGKFIPFNLDSYYGRANTLTFLASAMLIQGKDGYEKYFQTAYDFFDAISYIKGKATVLSMKAMALNRKGDYNQANKASKIALDYCMKYGLFDFIWRIEILRGETFKALGQSKLAYQSFLRASEVVNSLSSTLSSDTSKRKFGYGKEDIVYNLVQYDIKNRDYAQLFKHLEEGRARAFVDMLSNHTITVSNSTLLKKLQTLDTKIKKQTLLNTAIKSSYNSKKMDKLKKLIKHREELMKQIEQNEPKLASVVSIWSNSLSATQQHLENNENILYFLPTKKNEKMSYLLISKDSVKHHYLTISINDLKNELNKISDTLGLGYDVRALKLNVKKNSTVHKNDINKDIENLRKNLKINISNKVSKLFIIPHGISYFIPWGMISDSFTPSILPNASWVTYKNIQIDSKKVVILGNPLFGEKAPSLKGAEEEAIELSKQYQTTALIGKEATIEKLRNKVSTGVDILHLATHGFFNKKNPLDSFLMLSDGHDGVRLSAKAIYKKPLSANLVVLSACQTGLGKLSSGDDLLGLTRSFFLSGSKAVLTSLWEIEDEGTKNFMKIFHQYAKDGEYIKGYKKAIDILKAKGYPPSVYGAFILNGTDKF